MAGMKLGLSNLPTSAFGTGPGRDTAIPRWGVSTVNATPSNIGGIIDVADANDVVVLIGLSGSRDNWTTTDPVTGCKTYVPQDYFDHCNQFSVAGATYRGSFKNMTQAQVDKVQDAFNRRRLICYVGDELLGSDIFCGSISKVQINDMGVLHKTLFPGALCALRMSGNDLNPAPAGGWTGIDYGWIQHNGGFGACASVVNGSQPFFCYKDQITKLKDANLGTILGQNILNGGDGRLWDCQNTGSSSCRVVGEQASRWLVSPTEIRNDADAAASLMADPLLAPWIAPISTWWTYIYASFSPQQPWLGYETRPDFVSAYDYALNKYASITASAWRTSKDGGGNPPPPPPPPPPTGNWSVVGTGAGGTGNNAVSTKAYPPTPATLVLNQLAVIEAYSRDGSARSPVLPSGWLEAKRVSGGATNGELAIFFRLVDQNLIDGAAGTATGEGKSYVTVTYSGAGAVGIAQQTRMSILDGNHTTLASVLGTVSAGDVWATTKDLGPISGLTPATGGGIVIVFAGRNNDFGVGIPAPDTTVDVLTGDGQTWQRLQLIDTATANDSAILSQYAIMTGTPTITSKTFTNTGTATGAGCGCMVCFNPVPNAATAIPVLAAIGTLDKAKDSAVTFAASATGGAIVYSLVGAPVGASINASTGAFTWTPSTIGDFTFTVKATNSFGNDTKSVTIRVDVVPVMTAITNKSIAATNLLSFTSVSTASTAHDVWSLDAGFPTGAAINASTGAFTWTPTANQQSVTPYPVTVRVTNPLGTDTKTFTITVTAVATKLPTIGDRQVNIGDLLRIVVIASNPLNGTLVYSLTVDHPAGATITPAGVFTYEPAAGTAGSYTCTFSVTDGTFTDTQQIHITVTDVLLSSRSAIITGLAASTAYDVRVAHLDPDSGNLGDWATGAPYATTTGAVPAAPTLTAASAITKSGFTVNWTNGITGAGVTETLEYRQVGDPTWIVISGIVSGTLLQAVTGLVAGTAYEVRLKHISSGVSSAYVLTSPYATTVANPPSVGAPSNLTITTAVG